MATLRQSQSRGASVDLRKFAPPSQGTHADNLNIALAPVFDDIGAGCAPGATIVGPTRTFTGGQRVIVAGWTTAPGTLFLETSTDGGATWPASDSEPVLAGDYVVGVATTTGASNRYRIRYVNGPVGATRVAFSTQSRP